jgi:hypothetical protein
VGDAAVESPADDGAASFENVDAAKVLPETERNWRQLQARAADGTIFATVVTVMIGHMHGTSSSGGATVAADPTCRRELGNGNPGINVRKIMSSLR